MTTTVSALPLPWTEPPTASLHGVAHLHHLGVIHAQGEEAAAFLHGQLTQDFALLRHDRARLAAYCSAKGRMLASFIGWRQGEQDIWLVCDRETLPATLKRLSMFVLRAKVKLRDATADLQLLGAVGDAVPAVLRGRERWARTDDGDQTWVRLPDALGLPRALCARPAAASTPLSVTPQLSLATWHWLEVRSGVAPVVPALADALVPQMLNYESVDGVNFQKGCYPGQEVVARSQFRGTLKRRAFLVHADSAMTVGQEVFHVDDAEQPCGMVVCAAPHPVQGWDAMVSMQIAAADGQTVTLGSAQGARLQLLTLPYPLRNDL
jgi:folate-binding protein YgfZ